MQTTGTQPGEIRDGLPLKIIADFIIGYASVLSVRCGLRDVSEGEGGTLTPAINPLETRPVWANCGRQVKSDPSRHFIRPRANLCNTSTISRNKKKKKLVVFISRMKLSPVLYFKHKNIDLSAQVYLLVMYKPAVFCDNLNNLNLSLFVLSTFRPRFVKK